MCACGNCGCGAKKKPVKKAAKPKAKAKKK
ncbi:MAG: hypothetical protein BWY69_01297 [Planctomycetes bacterium ADurb.Bin401]|nr:MAG: hypothetical protein BWY69_01297 [Planctomycetes bacterium ADurb.Bin401]